MTRALQQRVERLEKIRTPQERPKWIVGTCPLPDHSPNDEMVDQWFASGAAHIAFGGHAILYDGGRGKLTLDEWVSRFSIVH